MLITRIELENIKSYRNVTVDFRRGTTAIHGPNGAGKTTTVETLEGYRIPDAGSVRVLGLDPIRESKALKPPIGVIVVAILIALLIACFVVVLRNWRCPACNRFLGAQSTGFGASMKLRNCPKCGVELVG